MAEAKRRESLPRCEARRSVAHLPSSEDLDTQILYTSHRQRRLPAAILDATTVLRLQRVAGNHAITSFVEEMAAEPADRLGQSSGSDSHTLVPETQHFRRGQYAVGGSRIPTLQREMLADDPYPATADGEQPGMMTLSDEGLEFLARHEGVRLKLYNDSEGHCTIGVGHLVHKGKCDGSEPKKFRDGLTRDEVMDLFRDDVSGFEAAVSNAITSRINQHQFDALVSFAFNIGAAGFEGSGALARVNAKEYSKVPAEMMKWVKPAAIKGRRQDEATLFRTGKY